MPITFAALAAGVALVPPAGAKTPAPPSNTVTCGSPVGLHDSARSLLRRFGRQARIEHVPASEDEPDRVVALYPLDPMRRIVVTYFDNGLRDPSRIIVTGRQSAWTFAGLKLGDTIDRVVEANRKHFDLWGFGWEQGGDNQNWDGGALAAGEAVCSLGVRFRPTVGGELPAGVRGEVTLRSDQQRVRDLHPQVSELSLNLPGGP